LKLGGHETFYPRPGWLTKGLLHLKSGGAGTFGLPEVADDLGVGRNMAKSIGWWLQATGLAVRSARNGPLEATAFGAVIAEHDPYMVQLGTWWLLHTSAMTSATGTSLPWFFSPRRSERTHRTMLTEALRSDLAAGKPKVPTTKSVQREVSAVLQTYAVPVPHPRTDPEDNLGSPFHRLDLWRHLRASDHFERSDPTPAPAEALGLALSALATNTSAQDVREGVRLDVTVSSQLLGRAGAFLGQSRDALLDMVGGGEAELGASIMSLRSLAGERIVTVESGSAATWAARFYDRTAAAGRKDAA
jgi:hypothetical protein